MKLTIKQSIINEQLNYIIKGISSKNIIPILHCIKLSLKEEGLYLLSTDNDITIQSFIPVEKIERVIELGDIVVPGKLFSDIIRALDNSIIKIEELVDAQLSVETESSSFLVSCNNAYEYPEIDLNETESPIYISKKIFKSTINQTIFATATSELKPVLTGINFKFENNGLECVATDSYRLAKKTIVLSNNVEKAYNIVIPTKNLSELTKMLGDDDNNIEIHLFENRIMFKFNSIILISSLINGSYPDVTKLIPTDFSLIVNVKLRELISAIGRASLFTNESDRNTISFETKGEEATIMSNIPEKGRANETLKISKNNEEDLKIAFSSKYMLDALKTLDCDDVTLMFNGNVKPIIIKNPNNNDILQLVLPIRV